MQVLIQKRDAAKAALQSHAHAPRIQELTATLAALRAKGKSDTALEAERDKLKAERDKACGVTEAQARLTQARQVARAEADTNRAAHYVKLTSDQLETKLHELTAQRRALKAEVRAINVVMSARNSEGKVAKILGDLSPADRKRLLEELSAAE
jgi:hypothetical protein